MNDEIKPAKPKLTLARRFYLFKLRCKVFYAQTLMKFGIVPKALVKQFAPNPMLKFPRNADCWCGSYKKAKHCCLPKQAPVTPAHMVEPLKKYMVRLELMRKPGPKIHLS